MANQFLLVLAAAAALQKPPTPPRPPLKAVDDPALNSLSNERSRLRVLAHDDGAGIWGMSAARTSTRT